MFNVVRISIQKKARKYKESVGWHMVSSYHQ